jgi:hypothetical protein
MTRKSIFFMALTLVAVLAVGLAQAHGVGVIAGVQHQPITLLPLIPLMGVISDRTSQTTSQNPSPALDLVRANQNVFLGDYIYFLLNGVMSTTVATQPVCAQATTASKAKTTNATVLREAGAAFALAATDNYWTLAPAASVLAVASFRRYLLIDTAGVASVLASNDSTVSAASCRFPALPANGSAVVGVLTVATDATHTFTPATTALNAAGITATFIDGIDINVPLAQTITP